MFEYIGRKIKVLAKVLFWMGLIAWVLFGIIGIILGIADGDGATAIGCFILMLVMIVANVVSSWLVYGLGQLIDNTDKLVSLKEAENGNTGDINNNIYTNFK